jgi:hypothetical protein
MAVVNIYCDGSVSDSILTDVYTSVRTGEYIGRLIVLAPYLDFGYIDQFTDFYKRRITSFDYPRKGGGEFIVPHNPFSILADSVPLHLLFTRGGVGQDQRNNFDASRQPPTVYTASTASCNNGGQLPSHAACMA